MFACGLNTSGRELTEASEKAAAARADPGRCGRRRRSSTRPSGSCVAVGYQRPRTCRLLGCRCSSVVEDRRVVEPLVGVDVAPDDQRAAVGELDVPRAEEIPPVRNPRKSVEDSTNAPNWGRLEAVEHEDEAGRLEGHVDGDDRPRTGALQSPIGSGGSPGAALEPPRTTSANEEGERRESRALPTRDAAPESLVC